MTSCDQAEALVVRPVAADEPLLFEVYASTRADEMALTGWTAAQQEAFVRQQYAARTLSYAAQFPGAIHGVVELDGRAVGYSVVDRGTEAWRVVDLALLPECRGRGIGTRLMQNLQREAAEQGMPVHLAVIKANPAIRLYGRLGFRVSADRGMHWEMEWREPFSNLA